LIVTRRSFAHSRNLVETLIGRSVLSSGARIRSAVTALFDEAATDGPVSTRTTLEAAERLRARRIVVDRSVDLPVGVCGRWVAFPAHDLVQIRADGATADWTTFHELGHMILGHRGRPATELAGRAVQVAAADIIDYMLTRGGAHLSAVEEEQEQEAESFARLLSARIGAAAGSPSPTLTARLDETLS
jgi:hypothetical protein